MSLIEYTATPTLARFMTSPAFVRFVLGPVGSGKTTGVIFEILRRAAMQAPGADGVRRTRWAVVRQTLEQMKQTILLDMLHWLQPIATYKVSDKEIILRTDDVHAEVFFIPLEDPDDQKRLLSSQLTGCVMNEFPEVNPDLVAAIAGRCGRFPQAPTWFGIFGDGNFPTEGSDWHRMMEDERPSDWAVFKQPSGLALSPEGHPIAENLNWLTQTAETLALPIDHPDRLSQGLTYYTRLANSPNQDWVKRYVRAEYGPDPSGTAVFKGSFKRSFHVSMTPLEPIPGKPILIGQDFGRNPCALICQPDHKGRLLVLEEVVSLDMGLELHMATALKPRLTDPRYLGLSCAAVGDPSGSSKSSITEETSFDTLRRLGLPAFPAPTNDLVPRITAVESLLMQQRDGGAALLIDGTRCPKLVQALQQNYRYGKNQAGVTKPLPEKDHPWSDLADDLQYVALTYNSGLVNFIAKKIAPKPARRPPSRVNAAGWT